MRRPSGHREHQHDVHGMRLALEEAQAAAVAGEVPVGAVLMRFDQVLSRGRNRMKGLGDPRRHAEVDCLDARKDSPAVLARAPAPGLVTALLGSAIADS